MNRVIVYSVIVTYDDYEQDLDNLYASSEAALASARKIIKQPQGVIRVEVQKDEITDTGRHWLATLLNISK